MAKSKEKRVIYITLGPAWPVKESRIGMPRAGGRLILTSPVNLVVRVISFPHEDRFLEVVKAGGFVRVLPTQVQTPPDLV